MVMVMVVVMVGGDGDGGVSLCGSVLAFWHGYRNIPQAVMSYLRVEYHY